MAVNKNHQAKIDLMKGFSMAERGIESNTEMGGQKYGMSAAGLPRTPAQQASVKKAARASAEKRGERASLRSPNPATLTNTPAANVAAIRTAPGPGAAGSLSIAKPKKGGLLL